MFSERCCYWPSRTMRAAMAAGYPTVLAMAEKPPGSPYTTRLMCLVSSSPVGWRRPTSFLKMTMSRSPVSLHSTQRGRGGEREREGGSGREGGGDSLNSHIRNKLFQPSSQSFQIKPFFDKLQWKGLHTWSIVKCKHYQQSIEILD